MLVLTTMAHKKETLEDKVVLIFDDGRKVVLTSIEAHPLDSRNKHRIGIEADYGVTVLRGPVFAREYPGEPIRHCGPRRTQAVGERPATDGQLIHADGDSPELFTGQAR